LPIGPRAPGPALGHEGEEPGRSVLVISRCACSYGKSQGGADVLARRHAAALSQSGFSVCLIAGSAVALPAGNHVLLVPPRSLLAMRTSGGALNPMYLFNELMNVIRAARRGNQLLQRAPFNLVVCNHSVATLLTRFRNPQQVIIHYVHDSLHAHRNVSRVAAKPLRWVMNDLLEILAARTANHVFCVSQGIADQLEEAGIPSSRIALVPPLVTGPSGMALETASLPIDDRAAAFSPFVLSVGQQTGRKRFDLLIRAMKWVPPNFSLVLVGEGPLHESYGKLVAEERLSSRVHILGGITDVELSRLYARAALFALVSESEGFPVAVSEARAIGRPVLVASPAASLWSQQRDDGLHLIPRLPSPRELGETIRSLLAVSGHTEDAPRSSQSVLPGPLVPDNGIIDLYSRLLDGANFPLNPVARRDG